MHVCDKLKMGYKELLEYGAVTIVVFGDSVTHGAEGHDIIDYEQVYWQRLRRMLNDTYRYMPVNVINSGIGGVTADMSVSRLERDVLCHHPDLVIVCFGLNDVNQPLDTYLNALRAIFAGCQQQGADVIFMTPNMFNTYVAEDVADVYREYAATTADMQNNGHMDRYMEAATALARDMGVTVCDCYAKWKAMAARGEDVTALLANRINHPTFAMHELFARELYALIMPNNAEKYPLTESTMYR